MAIHLKSSWDPNHAICPKNSDLFNFILAFWEYFLVSFILLIVIMIIINNKITEKNNKYNLNK